MGDITNSLTRRIERIKRDIYPPVVLKVLEAYAKAWPKMPEKEWPLARAGVIRSTVKRLKTDHTIGRWLWEQASPGNYMLVHTALDRLVWEICLWNELDERYQRMRLKLGGRYFLREVILVGLQLYEDDAPGALV